MNTDIIISMAEPYVQDGCITYNQFSKIFDMLSIKEQYRAADILFENGIDLIDEEELKETESFVLDVEEESEDSFEVLYDETIFKDQGIDENSVQFLEEKKVVKQSNNLLCIMIQQGNKQAEQDLCVKNERLVDKYVSKYQKRYGNRLDYEDLKQVGFFGLIKAAKKFNAELGNSFSTYAVWWIKQAISREIMDNGFAIRIPVHMMERINKVARYDNTFMIQGLNLDERIERISEELSMPVENVRECLILRKNYLSYSSLNSYVGEDEETELGELIEDKDSLTVEEIVYSSVLRQALEEAIESLKPREQEVIKMRFGLVDGREHTLEEIGERFDVTRERIRQIEAKALGKLRRNKRAKKYKDFLDE